ncbi:MAG: T9SS type A sorting domain-containing protein [Taibaiella sp.]|nr:T9SS type A sorting domain-containing protein [Taibaiella sp.]
MIRLFTLLFIFIFTGTSFAQIPNAGFETWTTVSGSNRPGSWDTPNGTVMLPGIFSCDSGMDAPPQGESYLKLTTRIEKNIFVPGLAVTGTVDIFPGYHNYHIRGGFPYTVRPESLTGKWRHKASTSVDHAQVGVYMWKWNTTLNRRDTVAFKDSVLTGMALSWTTFTIPLTYTSGLFPDSALIVLASSASSGVHTDTSYLYVDDLAFTGTVPSGVISVPLPDMATTVYPNPATGTASVYYHSNVSRDIAINLSGLDGKIVRSISPRATAGENSFTLNLHGLAQGVYFVKIIDENGIIQRKLQVE